MCTEVKKILKVESRAETMRPRKISRVWDCTEIVVTVCGHGGTTRWYRDRAVSAPRAYFRKIADLPWVSITESDVPKVVLDFMDTLVPGQKRKKRVTSSKRALKAEKMLAVWKRKLALAHTKVKHYTKLAFKHGKEAKRLVELKDKLETTPMCGYEHKDLLWVENHEGLYLFDKDGPVEAILPLARSDKHGKLIRLRRAETAEIEERTFGGQE